MTIGRVLILSVLVACAPDAAAQDATRGDAIAGLLDAYEEVYGFAGVALVAAADSVVFEGARGLADRGLGVPNRPTLRFPINSISKTFVAAAALVLVSDGVLDLHEPVATYLPDLDANWASRVTPHHLLSHTSGLPREFELKWYEAPTLAEQARRVARQDLRFEPGTEYGYSNGGYALLGHLVEEVAGAPYPAHLSERVLRPGGLEDTGVLIGETVVANIVRPYAMGPRGVVEPPREKHLGINAGGGLYSTAADLWRWALGLENGAVLPDSLQALLFTPHAEEGGPNDLAGYGWLLKRSGDALYRMAAGSGGGTKSAVLRDPESGLFIAVLSNWADVPVLELLRDLLFVATGVPVEPPSAAGLADPSDYADALGTYAFEPGALGTALGVEADEVSIIGADGRVYLASEGGSASVLRTTEDGGLALSYTDELVISFKVQASGGADRVAIRINGQELVGRRVQARDGL